MAAFGDDAVGEHNPIFGTTFSRGRVGQHLTDDAWLRALIRVEGAVVAAAERAGLIPAATAAQIRRDWAAARITVDDIGNQAAAGGNPVIPLVAALQAAVSQEARRYVHLGATSQDIMDSAMMLITREALAVLIIDLRSCAAAAVALAATHARTPIAGRTLMQDALPVTFGYKAAAWTIGLDGVVLRLEAVAATLPVQYGGPVGTFSGSGGRGPFLRRAMAQELGLADPPIAWHTIRLPIADLAGALGTAAGLIGKVALDIILMAQSAISEITEGVSGRGGSSSMAHKHNPVAAISARANAMRTPGLVGTLMTTMAQEHERAAGAWHAEWETLADLTRLTGSAAAWLADSLQHLQVDADRMAAAARLLPGSDNIEQAGVVVDTVLQQRQSQMQRTDSKAGER